MAKELKRGGGYVELGDHVVVRSLGLEVGPGVTVFFVVPVGRVAADTGLVVIVVDSVAGDAVGAVLMPWPRLASSSCSLISVEGVAGSIPCACNSAANKAASLISFDGAGVVVVRARPLKIDLKKDSSSCDNPDDFFEPTASLPS